MGLIFMDGFDHYDAADANFKGWTGGTYINETGRFGSRGALGVENLNPANKILPSSYSQLVVGFAVKITRLTPEAFFALYASGSPVVVLNVSPSLRIDIDGTWEGTTILVEDSFFYVELKIDVGAGTAEVQLNGAPEISATGVSLSNVDTIRFESHTFDGFTIVDDVYVLDSSGSAPNDFLGDVTVRTLYPDADGAHTAWTPDVGTDHYSRVNEHNFDGDGSFVHDATAGDKDTYSLDPLFASVVYAAQLNLGARKGDGSLRQIAPVIRQAATDHVGDTFTLSSDYVFYSEQYDKDPTGSDWTAATINADEFGVDLIA